jgi:hypothetical protein
LAIQLLLRPTWYGQLVQAAAVMVDFNLIGTVLVFGQIFCARGVQFSDLTFITPAVAGQKHIQCLNTFYSVNR